MELAQLKESLATLSAVQIEMASTTSRSYASSASTYSGSGCGSYASAAKQSNIGQSTYGRRTRGRQPSNDADSATKKAESSNVFMSATEPAVTAGKRPKIQVVGARRIWGTLRDSTVNSVKNVISRICKLENGIRVRRKTKVSPVTNKTKWWYVVHADEDFLTELNTKWDQVKVQTSWKLEPCFMFAIILKGTMQLHLDLSLMTQPSRCMTMRALFTMLTAATMSRNSSPLLLHVLETKTIQQMHKQCQMMIMQHLSLLLFWRCEHNLASHLITLSHVEIEQKSRAAKSPTSAGDLLVFYAHVGTGSRSPTSA